MTRADDLNAIREAYRTWNEEGSEAFLRFLRPDLEWITPPEVPGGGTFVGKTATAEFLRNFEGTMDVLDLSFQIQEVIPGDDQYLVVSLAEGTSASGLSVPAHHWFHLVSL